MPSKYNGFFFFRKEAGRGGWRRGQTPPTITVSTIDYTSPEKLTYSCLLHANNEETTTP